MYKLYRIAELSETANIYGYKEQIWVNDIFALSKVIIYKKNISMHKILILLLYKDNIIFI